MITYNTINVAMPDIAEAEVSAWVKSTAATYNKVVGDINYIFVDDETMLDINRRFIGHDYYTDHIVMSSQTRNSGASSFTACCTSAASATRQTRKGN